MYTDRLRLKVARFINQVLHQYKYWLLGMRVVFRNAFILWYHVYLAFFGGTSTFLPLSLGATANLIIFQLKHFPFWFSTWPHKFSCWQHGWCTAGVRASRQAWRRNIKRCLSTTDTSFYPLLDERLKWPLLVQSEPARWVLYFCAT